MNHSALQPGSPQAIAIRDLFHVMLPVAAVVYLSVMAVLIWVVWRRPGADAVPRAPGARTPAVVGSALVVAAAILLGVLRYNNSTARALVPGHLVRPVVVNVTGHQWWWEVEYEDSVPQRRARMANELHVPVGRPVVVNLLSHDVIHSFWVPGVGGKKDLIPGHHTSLVFQADSAGVYRGQCAEFCGAEHAKMALVVVAEPEAAFMNWWNAQRVPAAMPAETEAQRGRQLFETGNCSTCHTIAGTRAAGRVGPDLSHLASRRTIAAGTLENSAGNLANWLHDPQAIKPGAQMPVTQLAPADLQALVAYLMSLR